MTREERRNEILGTMKSFSKETYHKTEILPELMQLQKELVEVVFDEEHAANGNLKIWDVERYLEQVSKLNGNVGTDELRQFKNGCKEICNRIKAEISGNWGEDKTFLRLESMRCSGKVIRNVELTSDDIRTELDGVVITSKAIFIIEVKNTKKNIFSDEVGNYYRTGDYMNLDFNIGEKMRNKVSLLRDTLAGLELSEIKIESLVVFTNNRMEVGNYFNELKTCFLGQLPYIIEDYKEKEIYSEDDIALLAQTIQDVSCKESYAYNYDIDQFKNEFAEVVSMLEEASINKKEEMEEPVKQDEAKKEGPKEKGRKNVKMPYFLKKDAQGHLLAEHEKIIAEISGFVVLAGVTAFAITKYINNK